MKTLIYGMQSSGASLFTFWLAQQTNCIGVIDLYFNQLAPYLNNENVVLKCVATKEFTLEAHIESFQPDRVILFVRNPVENYLSLSEKGYADFGGTPEEKLAVMDSVIARRPNDIIIRYEDFILGKTPHDVGDPSYYDFTKSLVDVKKYNFEKSNWCQKNYERKWGFGNINFMRLTALKKHTSLLHLVDCYG